MYNIILNNIVNNLSSNSEGMKLYYALQKAYEDNIQIIINIDPEASISSSFLNSSIGMFLDKYGIDNFKKTVKVKSSRSQFNRLADYIRKYSQVYMA